jgi:hypothetical protein
MAVTVTNQSNPIGSRLVNDTDVTSAAADNTTGTTGTLYMVEVDNTANSSIVYFKMADSTNATGGTTAANLVLMVPASTKMSYVFPTGIAFSAGFSHWCVTGAAEANTTSPSNDVIARYVTS